MLEGAVPWPEDAAERYRRAGHWASTPIPERLRAWAAGRGRQVAAIAGSEQVTYGELRDRSHRLALRLHDAGLRRGDAVVVQLPSTLDFLDLFFALLELGAHPVLALPQHREHEIAHLVDIPRAAAYAVPARFGSFDFLAQADAIRARCPSLRLVLAAGETARRDVVRIDAGAPGPAPAERTLPAVDPGDVALFLLSGGTTGLPKLIPRTHDDYLYNFRRSGALSGFGGKTRYLVALPIAHNFPLGSPGILGVFEHGGTAVLTTDPSPEACFPLIARERIDSTALVPALVLRWLDSPLRASHDLSSLRVLQVGGARLVEEAARRVRPLLGCTVQQVFGMAEGLLNYTRLDDPETVLVETQGRPMSEDDEVRIVDDEDREVPRGERGNLLTRGPYTIRGYFRAAEHNRRAFTADGYYRTGDIVRWHPSGNLVVEGRQKDMINRGGEKISAEEVENAILGHPAVANAAAVAMPDPVLGERLCACVVLQPGASLTLAGLLDFMAGQKMARFKLPERLEVLDAFPLTNVGKVSKKDLRELVARKLEAGR